MRTLCQERGRVSGDAHPIEAERRAVLSRGRLSGRERKHRDSSAAGRRAGTFDGRSRNVRKDRRPAVFFFYPFLRPVEAVAVLGKVGGSLSIGSGRIRDSGTGDAFIDQRLLEDLGADRGREAAARCRPAVGLVEADETQKLGVVDGSHGHKAGDAGLLVGAVQLLAGAALAAYPVARDPGVPPPP